MIELEIIAIGCNIAIAACLPGCFLLLHGSALMSDAISHSILLGITLMFFVVNSLHSPLLIVGAAVVGVLTVVTTNALIQTQKLKQDSAIGLVFPLFFSIGVLLITAFARNVHLDIDMVLLGEIIFAPFNRLYIGGCDVGPIALWLSGLLACINAIVCFLYFRPLIAAIFDPIHAGLMGISITSMYYLLMVLTSVTAVIAFDIVGSLVFVALTIIPAATAFLLTAHVSAMLMFSMALGVSSILIGYAGAHLFDVSVAGAIACANGLIFIMALGRAYVYELFREAYRPEQLEMDR